MSIDKSTKDSNHGIARSAGVMALATVTSRILGFIRDIVIARLFGVYLYAQAFVIAFKIPNLFRDLVGEGATNAAIVPVFSEYLAKGTKEEFWELANTLMNVLLVVLSAITVLGIVFSPVLVRLIAPGFTADPAKFSATVALNRLIFPYILLIGLTAYCMGILNSLRHFALPAFGPCLLNISIIVCALVWGEGVKGLATGVLIGGILQLAVQVPVLYGKGFRFRFNGQFDHPAVRRIGALMAPRVFSSAIYQLNNFVDSIFGSLFWIVGEGGVAALYFSYRLIQFPLGVFGNSLSQAMLPALSCQAVEEDYAKLKETLLFGLRSVLFVMVPASVGFMVLSKTIVSSLFEGGRFNSYSTGITSGALFFYSIGLFAFGATRIVQCGYFALKDTVTPTKVAGIALILNIGLNAVLMFPMKLAGLALATSLSGIISFFILFMMLRKKLGGLQVGGLMEFTLRVLCASIVMGEVCFIASTYHFPLHNHLLVRIVDLLLPIICAAAAYFIMCIVLKIEQVRNIGKLFKIRT
ncbi:MAG: murein biosynthesis integral membrane protein MurJ [Candidatus Omnitrophota bacterium]